MNNRRTKTAPSTPACSPSRFPVRLLVLLVTTLFLLCLSGQIFLSATSAQVADSSERAYSHSAQPKSTRAEFDVFADDEAAARLKTLPDPCYENDHKQPIIIDWGSLHSEKQAEVCFFGIAVKLGDAKSFESFLSQNDFQTAAGDFHAGVRVVEGWRIFSGYKSAAQYFGPLSHWALQVLHPLNQAVASRGSGRWLLRIRLEYSNSRSFRPQKVVVTYRLELK